MWLFAVTIAASAVEPCRVERLDQELAEAAVIAQNLVGAAGVYEERHRRIRKAVTCLTERIPEASCARFYVAEAYAVRADVESGAGLDAMISMRLCGEVEDSMPVEWVGDARVGEWDETAKEVALDWSRPLPRPARNVDLWVDGRLSQFAPQQRAFILQYGSGRARSRGDVRTSYVELGDPLPPYARRTKVPVIAGAMLGTLGGLALVVTPVLDRSVTRCLVDSVACGPEPAKARFRVQRALFWGGVGAATSGLVLAGSWSLSAPRRVRPSRSRTTESK